MRRAYLEQLDPAHHWLIPDFQLMLTLAIITGCLLCLWLWRRKEAESGIASDLLFWGIPGLLVGKYSVNPVICFMSNRVRWLRCSS